MKERPIIYEPHPVSPERKAELKAAGYRIIDARFAPPDLQAEPERAQTKRSRRVKRGADH